MLKAEAWVDMMLNMDFQASKVNLFGLVKLCQKSNLFIYTSDFRVNCIHVYGNCCQGKKICIVYFSTFIGTLNKDV